MEAGLAEALATQREQARLLTDGVRMVRELFRAKARFDLEQTSTRAMDVETAVEQLGKWHAGVTGHAPRVDEPAQ